MSTDTGTDPDDPPVETAFTEEDRQLFAELSEEFADDERGRIFALLAQSASESTEVSN